MQIEMAGYVARTNEERTPKQLFFGWLPKMCATHGQRLRWRDKVRQNLRDFQIEEGAWYQLAQERNHW